MVRPKPVAVSTQSTSMMPEPGGAADFGLASGREIVTGAAGQGAGPRVNAAVAANTTALLIGH